MKTPRAQTSHNSLSDSMDMGTIWLAESSDTHQPHPKRNMSSTGQPKLFPTGISSIDNALPYGGIALHATHQVSMASSSNDDSPIFPPVLFPALLARQAYIQRAFHSSRLLVWIGKPCWPCPFFLRALFLTELQTTEFSLERQCLFLHPDSLAALHKTIDLCFRSPVVATIVCIIKDLPPALSRRFMLLANQHHTTGIFILPSSNNSQIKSFASSQWELSPSAIAVNPAWNISLLRNKGGVPREQQWTVALESNYYWQDLEGLSDEENHQKNILKLSDISYLSACPEKQKL